jgi:hypothetical protein
MLDGYPQLYQQHRLSCEAASVSMATHGLIDESTILAAMPHNRDPWLGFRGDIDGHTRLTNDLANYGIYAPPLAREMQHFGYQTTVISGTTAPAQLRYSIGILKLPVVVWIPYHLGKEPVILGHNGTRTFQLVRLEHARLVLGYDAGGIYSHDPIDGLRYDAWPTFLRAWKAFDDMGLIVAPPFPRYDPPALTAQLQGGTATWSWPRPAWPMADEATIFRAGQPVDRLLLAPATGAAWQWPAAPGVVTMSLPVNPGVMTLSPGSGAATKFDPATAILLGTIRASIGTDSLSINLAPTTPYTLTVSVVDPFGGLSPAAVSAPLEDDIATHSPSQPLFPPLSFFVLPSAIVGGSVVILPLPPQNLGSPTKPITRVQYSVAGGGPHYRVEVFASSLDAQTSFAWQVTHQIAGTRPLPAPLSPSGVRLYAIPGYIVAEVLYRNLEFAVSMPTAVGSVAPPVSRVLAIAQTLVERSSSYTGPLMSPKLAPPLFPPPYTFIFPDLGAYSVSGAAHQAQAERFYDYAFHPNAFAPDVVRAYHVMVEPTAERAMAQATAAARAFAASYQAMGIRALAFAGTELANPDLHAWAALVPGLRCASWEVFTYRNLWILLTDSSQDVQDTCNARVQGMQVLALRLLGTAQAYAQAQQP